MQLQQHEETDDLPDDFEYTGHSQTSFQKLGKRLGTNLFSAIAGRDHDQWDYAKEVVQLIEDAKLDDPHKRNIARIALSIALELVDEQWCHAILGQTVQGQLLLAHSRRAMTRLDLIESSES